MAPLDFFLSPTIFFFFFFFLFFWCLSLSFSRARERKSLCSSSSVNREKQHKNFFFFRKRLFDLPKMRHTPVIERSEERRLYTHAHTHFRRYARYETTLEMFARKSSVFVLLLFSVVLLLSVSFAARFGGFVQRRGKNENTSLTSHRRALLQRARCSNPWCFLISRRQRVKIRQFAVPQCARRVKPFSCSLEYCCASWCRNLPWEMLIRAPPPLCRDCVIAYRPGCCGWCKQVPSQYYGGVVGCYNCLAYALEVRFVPIIKPIYGRCEYCEWSPTRYISSPTFVNVINNNVNININIFQKTIVQPPQPVESLGGDECRNIGGCGFDAPAVDEVPADEPLTPDEAAAGVLNQEVVEEQLTDAVLIRWMIR